MTRVAVLTPPGTGAIAVIAVAGPESWSIVRKLFRRANGKSLTLYPANDEFWYGSLGDGAGDEVVVAATGPHRVEVHCHGGRRIVRWVVEQFLAEGCTEVGWQDVIPPAAELPQPFDSRALAPLTQATTVRTAGILLDQYHGAFARAIAAILESPALDGLADLARFSTLGRHLVAPWKVVIAGPPNVGKSSLVNALAGFQRSVVAAVAGTTRDVVTTRVAFDGWPVELSDTAGLRLASDGLEAEGIARARHVLGGADLAIWVLDGSDPAPVWPTPADGVPEDVLIVRSKADRPAAWQIPDSVRSVSATNGDGIAELVRAIANRLVPLTPNAGSAVPFTSTLADLVDKAATTGNPVEARATLTACLPGPD